MKEFSVTTSSGSRTAHGLLRAVDMAQAVEIMQGNYRESENYVQVAVEENVGRAMSFRERDRLERRKLLPRTTLSFEEFQALQAEGSL